MFKLKDFVFNCSTVVEKKQVKTCKIDFYKLIQAETIKLNAEDKVLCKEFFNFIVFQHKIIMSSNAMRTF